MTKLVSVFFLLFLVGALSDSMAQATNPNSKPLSNDDVVSMIKTGLTEDIILAKMRTSKSVFDTSPDALKRLKEDGVPASIILAMIETQKTGQSNGAEENNGEPTATVYLYRRKEFSTRNMQPSVYVDETEVARMDDGRFFVIKLDPGKHSISSNKGLSGAAIDLKAGRTYFFRMSIVAGFWKGHSEITLVEKEQGMFELGTMKPLEPKWIKDKTRVSTPPLPAAK